MKSWCDKISIKKGSILKDENIVSRRPGNGISPMDIDKIIGKKVNKDLAEDYILSWSDLYDN